MDDLKHESHAEEPEQQWLIPYKNPLTERLGREFFLKLPRSPGVYFFYGPCYGNELSLLYVGKAKDLRARLCSYRHVHPERVSRKVVRLVNLVREIRYEICESETAALLRENELLREEDPPFNVVNTRPQSYYFIGMRSFSDQVRFRRTTTPTRQGALLFGAVKSRRMLREGYASLLRLLWASQNGSERFEFPAKLVRRVPPSLFTLGVPGEWLPLLKRFLNGKSNDLLPALAMRMLENPHLPPFYYHVIQADLETATQLYETCLRRNRELRLHHGFRGRIIPQEKVDDLLVLENQRRKEKLAAAEPASPGLTRVSDKPSKAAKKS